MCVTTTDSAITKPPTPLSTKIHLLYHGHKLHGLHIHRMPNIHRVHTPWTHATIKVNHIFSEVPQFGNFKISSNQETDLGKSKTATERKLPWPRLHKRVWGKKWTIFRRFWVKEPRRSENFSDEKCCSSIVARVPCKNSHEIDASVGMKYIIVIRCPRDSR